MSNNQQMVRRFSKQFRIAHWLYALSFFGLYFTGLPLYTDFFNWMYSVFSPEGLRLAHRAFAVLFVLQLVFLLVTDPKSFFHWIKQSLTWRKNDIMFFPKFVKEFFGGQVKDMPKQDFYNAGEKVNSLLQIMCGLMLLSSGVVMWFPQYFPVGIIVWSYVLHNIGFGLAFAVVIGHIYLSIGNPATKPSLRGMIKGDVPVEYVKGHHEGWYDELVAEGVIKELKPSKNEKGA